MARYDVPVIRFFCYNKYNSKTPINETEVSTLKNTALITGSTGGFGSCFVNIHAKTGGDLILVGQNETKLPAQKKS